MEDNESSDESTSENDSFKRSSRVVVYLNKKYKTDSRPNRKELQRMAKKTQWTYQQVYDWFEKKREIFNFGLSLTKFSKEDLSYLLKQYKLNRNPSNEDINKMVQITKLDSKQINQWFYRRNRTVQSKK